MNFTISFTLEDVVPTNAVIVGPESGFAFDLGQAFIVFHSPGPWPNGYDGSTAFFGSFELPSNLREDLAAGRTTLQLTGSSKGDFSGPILAALPPQIATLNFQGINFQLQFMAQAPYQYTVEYSESLGGTYSGELTAIPALSQTFEAVVTDSSMGVQTRFYRVRRELCCH